ncbi:SseB family protein [Neogemmobacter tilapiae]|uniref:SseB protein N-terminal domain-containing protein n=1 Tax=Neogemmobacter tilapiae TaxID=875041 RepID=A0A918TD59_9RHOB|nr:SseB family protein [Gemmobacter tilapiae]GHC43717.1 hypothetical protein GCM10007315_00980 [Gemmobacter tilapiae]
MTSNIDLAFQAMLAADEDAARLSYYGAVADTEWYLLLASEAEGQNLSPKVFDLAEGSVVLAFDSEERLVEFTGGLSDYAALPGRVIAAQLAGQGIGLGLNLGAPSQFILPPEAMEWLADLLTQAPQDAADAPRRFHGPGALPPALIAQLGQKIAGFHGLTTGAWLAGVEYASGRKGHLLAFVGAAEAAEPALARAAQEALVFSGVEAGEMDVTFVAPDAPVLAQFVRVGMQFPVLAPKAAEVLAPKAPGMDPDKPPRLK